MSARHEIPILMAEDSAEDAELALGALAECGLAERVVLVRDGAEALEYLFRRGRFSGREGLQPALVLLDMKMPKVDGLEVLRQTRGAEALDGVPVVMLSSSGEEGDVLEAGRLGATAYVVKPVHFGDFTAAVKTIGTFWCVLNQLNGGGNL